MDLTEKLATPPISTGPAACTTKQLRERWGCLEIGPIETVVITGHQRERWVRTGKDAWELAGVVKL